MEPTPGAPAAAPTAAADADGAADAQPDRAEGDAVSPGPDEPTPEELARILTWPNLISVLRLLGIPLFLYLLFAQDDEVLAAIVLGTLGATDWIDGFVARRYHQVSNLGKALDPTVDRLVLIVGVGAIIISGSAPLWFSLLVLGREVVIGLWTVSLLALGAKRPDVTWWGKAGTFANYFAFPLFMVGASDASLAPWFQAAGWIAAVPGLVLSYVAAVLYFPIGVRNLREGRAARHATDDPPAGREAP